MAAERASGSVDPAALERVLEVTRKLASSLSLDALLAEVLEAARSVLAADRGTLWLYLPESEELRTHDSSDGAVVTVPADSGIVGHAVTTRSIVNVPDAYADPRFNQAVDRDSGYRTRCLLTVPLVGHDDALIGVLQLLNKHDGVFTVGDERLAETLAAQCAVAIQRAQMTEALLETERLQREVAVAHEIQRSTLPQEMPALTDYEVAASFQPADATGGDTFDVVDLEDGRVLLLLGDATGHGFGPALSATQMQAMLRIALRMGADLSEAFLHVNNQMEEDLPDDRFVTAFMGELHHAEHRLSYHSGGQGPLLHLRHGEGSCDWHQATTFPLGSFPHEAVEPPVSLTLAPGDLFGLISDGVFEAEDAEGGQFGEARAAEVIRAHLDRPLEEVVAALLAAVRGHVGEQPQADDITILLLRRRPD